MPDMRGAVGFRMGEPITNTAIPLEELKLRKLESMVPFCDSHMRIYMRGSLIEGRFVYAVKNKPLAAGYAKTDAYVGGNRKLDA